VKTLSVMRAPSRLQHRVLDYQGRLVFAVMLLLTAGALWFAWLIFTTPGLGEGWEYQVYADGLEDVSALVLDNNGGMYVTLEKRHGQGKLLHITGGQVIELLDGMDKPDGMYKSGNSLYITVEAGKRALIEYKQGALRTFDGISNAEGIADAGGDLLLIVEDRKEDGRLLRVNKKSGEIEVLLTNLKEAEGVCQGKNGFIYFAEKTANSISSYKNGRVSTLVEGLIKPAFLNCLDDGSILITEDRTNFGRLLKYKDGGMEVIASRLQAPQSVIVAADGSLYVAEQRRNRILRLFRPG